MSRSRDIASFLGKTESVNTNNASPINWWRRWCNQC